MANNTVRDPCNENVVNIDQVLALGPIRPVIDFPKTHFGGKQLKFQERWYNAHDWLEYSVEKDAIYCFHCRVFGTLGEYTMVFFLYVYCLLRAIPFFTCALLSNFTSSILHH